MKATDPSALLEAARRRRATGDFSAAQSAESQSKRADFEHQAERTHYGVFRAQGYCIGSGVIEAGCKNVVGRRLKPSGMFWSEPGADHLLGLRCLILGPHADAAWAVRPHILALPHAKARRCLPSDFAAAA